MQAVVLKSIQTGLVASALTMCAVAVSVSAQTTPPIVACGTARSQTAPAPAVPVPPSGAPDPDSNVWNWQDVPKNEQIVIDRAVFDQGGYQLYCHTGETIVVPFTNQNIYVMKFGQSAGPMYFVTDGATPTLYVPADGYLENAAVPGAKWYPFPRTYNYSTPVYIGPAPTWDEYMGMGWYPGMVYYGGCWGSVPFAAGVLYSPMPGWNVSIDGLELDGWLPYQQYTAAHPAHRVNLHDAPGYRYDRFPVRGPQILEKTRRFVGVADARMSSSERTRQLSSFANPAYHARTAPEVTGVGSQLANPNLGRPTTTASMNVVNVQAKPVILGNPRFRAQGAVAMNPRSEQRLASSDGSALRPGAGSQLTGDPALRDSAPANRELSLNRSNPAMANRATSTVVKADLNILLGDSPGKKSSHNGGLFRNLFSTASSWVHDYAKSLGGGSDSGRSEHSDHAEKESHPASAVDKKK